MLGIMCVSVTDSRTDGRTDGREGRQADRQKGAFFKASLNFPNAQFFIITNIIVIKDVCSIAKIIPIDPVSDFFLKCEKINNFDRNVFFLKERTVF